MKYVIVHVTPQNKKEVAATVKGKHIVSLSGGLASAFAAILVIARYGREQVVLWFADVRYEDDDLYRFLRDFMALVGGVLYWFTDGRTPLDVAEERQLIPCDLAASTRAVKRYQEALQARREGR